MRRRAVEFADTKSLYIGVEGPGGGGKSKDEIFELIKGEEKRQKEGLEMIPSENYVSAAVREAVGSVVRAPFTRGGLAKLKPVTKGEDILEELM